MKKFSIKILIFCLPIICLVTGVIYIDFFKIFGFQDYYTNQKVGLNRETVTTTTYNHYRESEKFNSFIFGSSRSQAYKCANWLPYLDERAKPFHFDASGEGVWGISKKVKYIDEVGGTINNALVVIDRYALRRTYPKDGHMFIAMPCVSKSSSIEYYSTFLLASLNLKFLMAYIDYSIFKTHRDYMGHLIMRSKYSHYANTKNCDIWYGWDKEIKMDSIAYYKKQNNKGIFYNRTGIGSFKVLVTPEEKEQLLIIKNIFEKHNTNYKIIISPLYDQVSMEQEQIELLEDVFNKENIYNFSGKNKLTEPIYNFYETSHYRPHIANEILEVVYKK